MAGNIAHTRRDLFRFAAATGVTAAVGLGVGAGRPRTAEAVPPPFPTTPDEAFQALVDGNARFLGHNETSLSEDLQLINGGVPETHNPFAAILSCADARLTPEIVFDQIMGRLFVARVAGNIASPEIIASLEFAVFVLNVKLIMVLGHGECGAVRHTDRRTAVRGTQISALYAPLRVAVDLGGPGASTDAKSQLNARVQAVLIQDSSPLIACRVQAGALRMVAAYYNLVEGGPPPGAPQNGQVTILSVPGVTPTTAPPGCPLTE